MFTVNREYTNLKILSMNPLFATIIYSKAQSHGFKFTICLVAEDKTSKWVIKCRSREELFKQSLDFYTLRDKVTCTSKVNDALDCLKAVNKFGVFFSSIKRLTNMNTSFEIKKTIENNDRFVIRTLIDNKNYQFSLNPRFNSVCDREEHKDEERSFLFYISLNDEKNKLTIYFKGIKNCDKFSDWIKHYLIESQYFAAHQVSLYSNKLVVKSIQEISFENFWNFFYMFLKTYDLFHTVPQRYFIERLDQLPKFEFKFGSLTRETFKIPFNFKMKFSDSFKMERNDSLCEIENHINETFLRVETLNFVPYVIKLLSDKELILAYQEYFNQLVRCKPKKGNAETILLILSQYDYKNDLRTFYYFYNQIYWIKKTYSFINGIYSLYPKPSQNNRENNEMTIGDVFAKLSNHYSFDYQMCTNSENIYFSKKLTVKASENKYQCY